MHCTRILLSLDTERLFYNGTAYPSSATAGQPGAPGRLQ